MRALHRLFALACGFCIVAIAGSAQADVVWPERWESRLGADHPLVGRIWSERAKGFVSPEAFEAAFAQVPLVLVGEIHDNVDHHRVQAWVLQAVAARRPLQPHQEPSGAAVFEHIRSDQADALDDFRHIDRSAQRLATAHDLFRLLRWKESGWPSEDIFLPLYGAVVASRFALVPGDAPRETIRSTAKQGPSAVAADEQARLGLDAPLGPALENALLDELGESHCGLMPKTAFTNMAFAQRYRDAHLGDALLRAEAEHGAAILFAGNGHVRSDRGVPWYVHQRAPEKKMISVMLLEVEEGKTDPEAYVPPDPEGKPAADYIVLTPRAERKDPCEQMKAQFRKRD